MILSQNIRILTKKGKKLAKFGKNLAKFGKNSHSKHGQLWYCLKRSEFWQILAIFDQFWPPFSFSLDKLPFFICVSNFMLI